MARESNGMWLCLLAYRDSNPSKCKILFEKYGSDMVGPSQTQDFYTHTQRNRTVDSCYWYLLQALSSSM